MSCDGIAQLHVDGEIEPGRPAADAGDLHDITPEVGKVGTATRARARAFRAMPGDDWQCNVPLWRSSTLLSQFPPTHIFVGGIDPILDDGVFFAHRLHSLGRPVVLRVYDHLPHGFLNVTQSIPSSKHVVVDVASPLRSLCSLEPPDKKNLQKNK